MALNSRNQAPTGPIAVLKAGRRETVLHHGQGCTDLSAHGVGGAGIPYWIPGAALTLTSGARTEDVHRPPQATRGGLALKDGVPLFSANRGNQTGPANLMVLGPCPGRHLSPIGERAPLTISSPRAFFGQGSGNGCTLVGTSPFGSMDLPLTGNVTRGCPPSRRLGARFGPS